MPEKHKRVQIRPKIILLFVIFIIIIAVVTPVLADYIGPNRTVTETVTVCHVNLNECQYVASKDAYRYRVTDSWPCADESKPWRAYSNKPSPWGCTASTVGDTYWSRTDVTNEVTTTYPPATIDGLLQNCILNNGWCITPPQLALSGSEPVSGYNIIALEGSLNGQNFACPNANCSVPLVEGINDLTYWALSSFGDSSTMGTATAKVDSQPPTITGSISGSAGSNGWYVSAASFNGSVSDATSGLATSTCTLDGVALSSCATIAISGEGTHSLVLTASDTAGNIRTLTKSASIDTQNPTLSASLNGTLGSNNWYTNAALNATASDPTPGSGLSAFEYNIDGSSWIAFPASGVLTLPEGTHTVEIHAVDQAGHVASSSTSFSLDSVGPDLTVNAAGTLGSNNWFITNPSIDSAASDDTSGLDVFEYSLDNGTWTAYTSPLNLSDGVHSLSFWAQDKAGLVKQVDRSYQVDTRPPQIAGGLSGVLGLDGWYTSNVTISASASDPVPGSGMDAFTYILNSNASTSYTAPLSLTDGQHTVTFNAQDQAGLTYSITQNIKVDTIHPSLTLASAFPTWVKGNITLNGTADDKGSGLSKVEISIDDAKSWQTAAGTTSWSYDWNTQNNSDGSYPVLIRTTDKAGLTTEKAITVGVDNHAPTINLPDSWFQWNTVTLDIWDDFSGISEARLVIHDPHGRWPDRVIQLDPQDFPLNFKWDRRMGDGTIATADTYDIQVTAIDNLGNTSEQKASVEILLSILPAGPTATPQTYTRPQPTATPAYTATAVSLPTATPTIVINSFGAIEPTIQVASTPTSIATPRPTPTQTTVLSWLQSFFAPNPDSKNQSAEFISSETRAADSRDMAPGSNVLWGAAEAAMVGAATAYAAEERRRQQAAQTQAELEEEAPNQEHLSKKERDAIKAEEKERRHATVTRHMEKLQAQRAQEAAWEQARLEQQTPDISYDDVMNAKMARTELQQDLAWMASQQIIQKRYEEKKKAEDLQAGLAAWYSASKQGNTVIEESPEKTWWQQNVIEPAKKVLNPTTITGALLTIALGSNAIAARNLLENPHAFDEARSNAQVEWQHVLQMHPNVPADQKTRFEYLFSHPFDSFSTGYDRAKAVANIAAGYIDAAWQQNPLSQSVADGLQQIGDSCPNGLGEVWDRRCSAVFYFGAGLIEHPADTITGVGTTLVADTAAGAIKTAAFLAEEQNPIRTVSDMYHSIQANGFVDGVKDFYHERFAELKDFVADPQVKSFGMLALFGTLALLPALAIPTAILGSTLVAAQTITTFSQIDKLLQSAKTQGDAMQYASHQDIRRNLSVNLIMLALAAFGITRAINQVAEFQALQASLTPEAQASLADLSLYEQTRLAELAARMELSPEALDFYLTESARPGSLLNNLPLGDALRISSLTDTFGNEMMTRFLPFCEDYGINPYEVLSRPPAEGQSLIGWTLGIESSENPVNHPIMKLNLTEAERTNILTKSIVNPESKVVVLGYGKGVAKPYFILGRDVNGSFLSLPSDVWAPFENARANFWADINAPFIKMAIENRKIFLFNISKDVIENPRNIERFSLPELRLIEMQKNNYVSVDLGDYTAYVPAELLDSLDQYLPADILQGTGE